MSEGRKTRRIGGEKNEKAELDREWQQISQVCITDDVIAEINQQLLNCSLKVSI